MKWLAPSPCRAVLVLVLITLGCGDPDQAYEDAMTADSVEELRAVLDRYPDHVRATEAVERLGELRWKTVSAAPSVDPLRALVDDYPEAPFTEPATLLLDSLMWLEARSAHDESGYEAYLARFPEGRHQGEALRRLEELSWEEASSNGTIESLSAFLDHFPEGSYEGEARRRIQEIRDEIVYEKIRSPDVGQLRELVASGYDINDTERFGTTPLHYAADSCELEVMDFLLREGANPNQRGVDRATPLHWAVRSGCLPAVETLLSSGADITTAVPAGGGMVEMGEGGEATYHRPLPTALKGTALHWAAYYGHPDITSRLITAGSDVNATDGFGRLAIHHAARSGDLESARSLLDAGSRLRAAPPGASRAANEMGASPLHFASTAEAIEFFVGLGEAIDVAIRGLGTPLHNAAHLAHNEAVAHLLDVGADPNAMARWDVGALASVRVPPMWVAAQAGNLEGLRLLAAEGGAVHFTAPNGGSLLHAAAIGAGGAVIEYLVSEGLDLEGRANVPNAFPMAASWKDMTPLCSAASYGRLDAVKALLTAGAQIDAECNGDWNPLVLAIVARDKDTVVYLVNNGATRGANSHITNWATTDEIKQIVNEHFGVGSGGN